MADVERERVTALWREAADALEGESADVAAIRKAWRENVAELTETYAAECLRLREQLEAARKALQHYADQDTWDLDQLSYDESNTAGYVFWHYDGHRAEEPWSVARAALGVEGEPTSDECPKCGMPGHLCLHGVEGEQE